MRHHYIVDEDLYQDDGVIPLRSRVRPTPTCTVSVSAALFASCSVGGIVIASA